jgi:phosphoenolpyruvate synthase/pyruvate phosphate dikinase
VHQKRGWTPSAKSEVDKLTSGYADKTEYFVDTLARGIGTIAAAFWPKPVILRLSDFKTNEYAHQLCALWLKLSALRYREIYLLIGILCAAVAQLICMLL